jgi:dihydropteroate synthase
MKGSPKTMQDDPMYGNAVEEISRYLMQRLAFAIENGMEQDRLVIDPGIGFGKSDAHNLELLRGIPMFGNTAPVLIGASRKSLIGRILKRDNPADRLAGSLAVAGWAVMHGAHILRVHDVIDTCDVCRIMDTLSDGD